MRIDRPLWEMLKKKRYELTGICTVRHPFEIFVPAKRTQQVTLTAQVTTEKLIPLCLHLIFILRVPHYFFTLYSHTSENKTVVPMKIFLKHVMTALSSIWLDQNWTWQCVAPNALVFEFWRENAQQQAVLHEEPSSETFTVRETAANEIIRISVITSYRRVLDFRIINDPARPHIRNDHSIMLFCEYSKIGTSRGGNSSTYLSIKKISALPPYYQRHIPHQSALTVHNLTISKRLNIKIWIWA